MLAIIPRSRNVDVVDGKVASTSSPPSSCPSSRAGRSNCPKASCMIVPPYPRLAGNTKRTPKLMATAIAALHLSSLQTKRYANHAISTSVNRITHVTSSPKTAKGSLKACKTRDFSLLIYGSLYCSADKGSYGRAYSSDRPCQPWKIPDGPRFFNHKSPRDNLFNIFNNYYNAREDSERHE